MACHPVSIGYRLYNHSPSHDYCSSLIDPVGTGKPLDHIVSGVCHSRCSRSADLLYISRRWPPLCFPSRLSAGRNAVAVAGPKPIRPGRDRNQQPCPKKRHAQSAYGLGFTGLHQYQGALPACPGGSRGFRRTDGHSHIRPRRTLSCRFDRGVSIRDCRTGLRRGPCHPTAPHSPFLDWGFSRSCLAICVALSERRAGRRAPPHAVGVWDHPSCRLLPTPVFPVAREKDGSDAAASIPRTTFRSMKVDAGRH